MIQIKIIRKINLQDFENTINELLSEGWEISENFAVDTENYLYVIMMRRAAS
ncbi:hypothetical protein ACSLMO_06470 [Flavobacterium columnare]|jgi:hypothetical protein|uniref:hypothetical protein n=1 Tax=Flavobacterium columnare TaxID=996 RepID=UPI004033E605